MKGNSKKLKILAAMLLIVGVIFIGIGFNKKDTYSNGTYSSENAYVGGDAYNYIINAGYFTGYVTLGSVISLGAVVFYATSVLIDVSILNSSAKNLTEQKPYLNEESEELPDIN